jgi:hypothetical protein
MDLKKNLEKIGYVQSQHCECVFIKRSGELFLILCTFVDDIPVFSNSEKLVAELVKMLNFHYICEDKGPMSWFLAIAVERNLEEGYVDLSQEAYLRTICIDYGYDPDKTIPAATPEIKNNWSKADAPTTAEDIATMKAFDYRKYLGQALWNHICVNPATLHAIKMLATYTSNPGIAQRDGMNRLFKYFCGTTHARLRLHGQRTLKATLGYIVDSDDASNVDHRRSLS